MRVLVIDDDPEVLDLVARALEREGHAVQRAASLAEARAALLGRPAEVLVLDLGLPDGSGITLCQELRAAGDDVPVLVLTARSEIAQRVAGLDAGADDFLAKPFAVAELRARVRALGRRRARAPVHAIERAGLRLDLGARRAERDGTLVTLTAREWAILDALAARNGRVVPRGELLDEVWGEATDSAASSCEVLVARIRRKLGDDLVRTLRGEGYALAVRGAAS